MSDLTNYEWDTVKHLFYDPAPRKAIGRPSANPRAVLDAIRWIESSGERWLYLPANYPPQQTCYSKFLQWKKDGRLSEAMRVLVEQGVPAAHQAMPASGQCAA
jgi:transposase